MYIKANWNEVEWSTEPPDRRAILPVSPVMVRPKCASAIEAGLLPLWSAQQIIAPAENGVDLIATHDWDSPVWPTGYPEDGMGNRIATARRSRSAREDEVHERKVLRLSSNTCPP